MTSTGSSFFGKDRGLQNNRLVQTDFGQIDDTILAKSSGNPPACKFSTGT